MFTMIFHSTKLSNMSQFKYMIYLILLTSIVKCKQSEEYLSDREEGVDLIHKQNIETRGPNIYVTTLVPDSECGQTLVRQSGSSKASENIAESKIIGGSIAPNGSWPWMCALFSNGTFVLGKYYYWCGSTIINNAWLVTAAHCMKDRATTNWFALCGQQNITQWVRNTSLTTNFLGVSQIVIHPNYSDVTIANDVALIQLNTILNFGPNVQAACLPPVSDTLCLSTCPNTTTGTIAGWGSRNLTIPPVIIGNPLLQVQVPFVANTVYGYDNTKILAGKVNASTCSGDSGGPLVSKNTAGKMLLYGALSGRLGPTCGGGPPSIFARMSTYRPWIESTLAKTNGSNVYVTTLVPDSACGKTLVTNRVSKIVGGSIAPNGTWPSLCAIFRISTVINNYYYFWTTATIINNAWLITTSFLSLSATDFVVLCGQQDITQWISNPYYNASYLRISKLITNPDSNTDNQIVLIKLSSLLVFNRYQQPICLSNATDTICVTGCSNSTTGLIAGWGNTNTNGPASSQLQQSPIPLISNVGCISNSCLMCARAQGIGACYGDSGAPLVIKDATGKSIQYGITRSFQYSGTTPQCGAGATIFNRVSCYRSWVESTIQTN